MIAKAVYICTQCNEAVPNPVKGKCPRGHLLTDRQLFFPTRELSFGASFLKTLGVCIAIFLAATVFAPWYWHRQTFAQESRIATSD